MIRIGGFSGCGMSLVGGIMSWCRSGEIAADALAFDAWGVVMAHNHPSGDATPSDRDLAFTRALAAALRTLEVVLVDHLVIAGERVASLRAMGVV
ncbi:JAB domain-containing protein [Sphingomonas aurantiaca]|uniref:JAB domain-containing protein n=1 Tax=Sphingomonas aurantiaca TaxID=185949 RepID=UPI002FE0B353